MPDKTIEMFGVPMHAWTMQQTIQEIAKRLEARQFTQHVVVNVAKMVNLQRDARLRDAVLSCDIINIDGMGVVWGGRCLGWKIPERVAGVDLFYELLALAEERGEPVYFLGARQEIIERTVATIRQRYPALHIAGWHHGYFWDDTPSVIEDIRCSGASLLFVALTSPKKEQFIHQWREQLGVKFAMGVGGTFDVVAGETRRAPRWMQQVGLEWFFRLLQEPRRMWKRYLLTNSKFGWMLINELLQQSLPGNHLRKRTRPQA